MEPLIPMLSRCFVCGAPNFHVSPLFVLLNHSSPCYPVVRSACGEIILKIVKVDLSQSRTSFCLVDVIVRCVATNILRGIRNKKLNGEKL